VCRNGFTSILYDDNERVDTVRQVTFVNRHFKSLVNRLVHHAHTGSLALIDQSFKDLVPEYGVERVGVMKEAPILPLGKGSIMRQHIEVAENTA
jgi:hypothetical protein